MYKASMFNIYKIETDDKRNYIGCTSQPIKMRLAQHKHDKRPFMQLPFRVEIIDKAETKQKALFLETYYIGRYDATNPEKGWNTQIVAGSNPGEKNGMFGKIQSLETRNKIRQKATGRKGWSKGMKFSEERKEKMRKARAGKGFFSGESHPMFGKKQSEETRKKISQARIDKGIQPAFGKGSKHSEETKQKMRDSKRRRKIDLLSSPQ